MDPRNRYFISFGVTAGEKEEIEYYVRHKKRWRTNADLARDALWQLMARNPVYVKTARKRGDNS